MSTMVYIPSEYLAIVASFKMPTVNKMVITKGVQYVTIAQGAAQTAYVMGGHRSML